jgi:hypothetical protein
VAAQKYPRNRSRERDRECIDGTALGLSMGGSDGAGDLERAQQQWPEHSERSPARGWAAKCVVHTCTVGELVLELIAWTGQPPLLPGSSDGCTRCFAGSSVSPAVP